MDYRCLDVSPEYRNGKKLPAFPPVVLHEASLRRCVTECEFYMFCLSVNFNRKLRMCELNSQKTNGSLSLADDNDFIYRDIPGVVSITICIIHVHIFTFLPWNKNIQIIKFDKTFSRWMLQKRTEHNLEGPYSEFLENMDLLIN
jgi:hypothetical protein